ncbi:MAG TPA: LLM class F420-dependent oxidoreductase [Acidimicrobiales bacterium]|nr:LLM class F420-dependent oxidoreductase [Acidimicrobiales bacterium]
MDIGVVYPQIELGGSPDALKRFALAAEELGYDHLVAYDHVLGAVHEGRQPPLVGPYTQSDPFHDPLMMFSYLSGITTRLAFFSGIIILPQRQTALVARQVADLDLFSGGRFRLGVGVGWNYVEYEALGQDFHTRGKREEEQIALLRRLWTEPVVDFSGRFDRIDRAGSLPLPGRPVPIWLGGWGRAAFERAARIGDGFIFGGRTPDVIGTWERVKEMVAANGRAVADFGAETVVYSTTGPERVAEHMAAWREAGGTHVSLSTMNHGFATVDEHISYMDAVAKAVSR